MSTENPLTQAGIEPATFRFVAQHIRSRSTKINLPGDLTTEISALLN